MGELLGRYELLHKIAAGGMGEVFLARPQGSVGTEQLLVIKTLLPHLTEDQDFVAMFFDEARIAAMLHHPNIAEIYDLGEASGRYFIAMEYVHGETLRALETAGEATPAGTPLGLKCRIIASAALALDHAHSACNPAGQPMELIHRDVSPHNIMVGFSGVVKLVDFGVAKANIKLARTATGVIKGKVSYMSPEQANGLPLDRRSDVFSLGIVFHQLLTGQRLFRRATDLDTLRAVVSAPIAPPSETTRGIPRAIDAIVLKALARKREDRYQSCGQLNADLEQAIARQRLPATQTHLATHLAGLFPAASAPPRLTTEGHEAARTLDESTAEVSGDSTAPARPARSTTGGELDPEQLEARLSGCAATDRTWGWFFNAVEAAVLKTAGAGRRREVRDAAQAPKDWVGSIKYPTRDFLRVLWRGIEVLAPQAGGVDAAFERIGAELVGALLGTPLAAPLRALPPRPAPGAILGPLVAMLQPMIEPGSRVVAARGEKTAQVLFKGEVLPMQLFAAVVRAACAQLGAAPPVLSWEKTLPERIELNLRW